MSNRALVELTIRYGWGGHESKTLAVQIPEEMARELMTGVELSDDPFSMLLASPAAFGGKGDALTIRRNKFHMRKRMAEDIAQALIPAILEAFGVNDELDGYKVSAMDQQEREYHKRRGRLP